jgi:hypothetical protein
VKSFESSVAFVLRYSPSISLLTHTHSSLFIPVTLWALHVFTYPLSAVFLNYFHLPFSFICSTISISLLPSTFFVAYFSTHHVYRNVCRLVSLCRAQWRAVLLAHARMLQVDASLQGSVACGLIGSCTYDAG